VLFFARPREVVGASRIELEVPEQSTPESVFAELSSREPRLAPMRNLLRCAIDQDYSSWDAPLHDGAELALIPPTAGG
jgi:molybdopterin converting factor small subunit